MKKQYILAVLLLLGAATVSTMAFPITDDVHDDFNLYDISPTGGVAEVSNVRIRAMGSDVVYFKITLAGDGVTDGRFHISFLNENAAAVNLGADCVVTYAISDTTLDVLDTLAVTADTYLVIDVDAVHATTDYILLKLTGSGIAYDGAAGGTDLDSMTISAYDMTGLTDNAGAYTEAEASDM